MRDGLATVASSSFDTAERFNGTLKIFGEPVMGLKARTKSTVSVVKVGASQGKCDIRRIR